MLKERVQKWWLLCQGELKPIIPLPQVFRRKKLPDHRAKASFSCLAPSFTSFCASWVKDINQTSVLSASLDASGTKSVVLSRTVLVFWQQHRTLPDLTTQATSLPYDAHPGTSPHRQQLTHGIGSSEPTGVLPLQFSRHIQHFSNQLWHFCNWEKPAQQQRK